MGTTYIDSNTLIYCFGEQKSQISNQAMNVINDPDNTIICSTWSLVEIAKGTISQAEHLAHHLMTNKIAFIAPIFFLARLEVENFMLQFIFAKNAKKINPFCETLPQLHACYPDLAICGIHMDINPLYFIAYLQTYPECMSLIESSLIMNAKAVRVLIQAEKSGAYKQAQKEEFFKYMSLYIPEEIQHNGIILPIDKQKHLEYCWEKRKLLYKHCPSLNIERHLCDFRRGCGDKKFTTKDIVDLQHQTCALPYCDYFITNDGFVCDGNNYVAKRPGITKIATTIRTEIENKGLDKDKILISRFDP